MQICTNTKIHNMSMGSNSLQSVVQSNHSLLTLSEMCKFNLMFLLRSLDFTCVFKTTDNERMSYGDVILFSLSTSVGCYNFKFSNYNIYSVQVPDRLQIEIKAPFLDFLFPD